MKTRRLMIGLLFAVGMSSLLLYRPAYAKDLYGAISYQISMPTGDTQNFVDNTSYAGVGLDIRRVVRPNVTLGLFFGWNVFHEHSSEPININTGNIAGTVTGKQSRTLTSIPMMVNASYYFGQRGGIRPYVGLNLGGFVFYDQFSIGIFAKDNTRGDWGMAPEVGVVIPVDYDLALLVSAKYNYAFTGESVTGADINNSYVSFNIGLAWQD